MLRVLGLLVTLWVALAVMGLMFSGLFWFVIIVGAVFALTAAAMVSQMDE